MLQEAMGKLGVEVSVLDVKIKANIEKAGLVFDWDKIHVMCSFCFSLYRKESTTLGDVSTLDCGSLNQGIVTMKKMERKRTKKMIRKRRKNIPCLCTLDVDKSNHRVFKTTIEPHSVFKSSDKSLYLPR